jgi:serine/threonine-protein phosphatase PGAM5
LATTLLYLVRHAEQQHPPGGEDPDGRLSPVGERQAHRLGRRIADVPFDVMRHSPLRRAAQTAHILAGYPPGVPVSSSELLSDRTPIPSADQASAVPPLYRPFLASVPAEERDPAAARLNAAVEQLAVTGAADRHELLITHNFVIGWFVRHALDAPAWRWMGLNQFNCALTITQVRSDLPPMLITFNDLGHLPVELRGHAPIALSS